jgi:hypothetical protein
MKSIYVIMSHRQSPIAITYPKPVMVCNSRIEALHRIKSLNAKAASNRYFIEKAERGFGL